MAWLHFKLLNPLVARPHVLVVLQDIHHIQHLTAKLCQTYNKDNIHSLNPLNHSGQYMYHLFQHSKIVLCP